MTGASGDLRNLLAELDTCECGDYRRDHGGGPGGAGSCRSCVGDTVACPAFRLHFRTSIVRHEVRPEVRHEARSGVRR